MSLAAFLHSTPLQNALREYGGEHFDPAEAPQPHLGVCRRCGARVNGNDGNYYFFCHLAVCVGVDPVIRDLEGIIRTVGAVKPP